jgi:3'(2'), 5'-bisphosphate nucleotidase
MPLSDQSLSAIRSLIQTCGREARQMANQDFHVYEKGKQDYVTDVDRCLDRQLTQGLTTLFPQDAIISEENPASWPNYQAINTEAASRFWLIDPLDGTSDFIHRNSHYAVMAGLLQSYRPVAGWVYAPAFDQLYYGGAEIGLFEADGNAVSRPLQPTEPAHPSASYCPIMLGYQDQRRYGSALMQLIPAAQFHSIGSFGLKVVQVIRGHAGLYLYFNRRVKLWDTTAPLALAEAAGLVCCDLYGEPLRFTPDVIETATLAHQQMIIIGWHSYVNAFLPCIQQAVLQSTSPERSPKP